MAVNWNPNEFFRATDTTGADPFNYEAFNKRIQQLAGQTATPSIPKFPSSVAKDVMKTTPWFNRAKVEAQIGAARASYQSQADVLRQQSQKAATALQLKGAATSETMRRVQAVRSGLEERVTDASGIWDEAIETMKGFVQQSYKRTAGMWSRFESSVNELWTNREFARAHALQAAAQSTIQGSNAEGRAIAREYGEDSKEYQQFMEKKSVALGTARSQIHARWQELAEEQAKTVLNAQVELGTQMSMYEQFHEQQLVQTQVAAAQSNQTYGLQLAQTELAIEGFVSNQMESMADYIRGTEVFALDLAPIYTLLSELIPQRYPVRYPVRHLDISAPASSPYITRYTTTY